MTRLGLTYHQRAPELPRALSALTSLVRASETLGQRLIDLVYLRASQLNGCAFCVEMHVAEAGLHGEAPERLHALATWRESGRFDERERAALAWTERLTRLDAGVTDEQYEAVRRHFSDRELVELTFGIGVINLWNRLNVAFGTPAEKGRELVMAREGAR